MSSDKAEKERQLLYQKEELDWQFDEIQQRINHVDQQRFQAYRQGVSDGELDAVESKYQSEFEALKLWRVRQIVWLQAQQEFQAREIQTTQTFLAQGTQE